MPTKPETRLYQRLRENLPDSLFTRLESRVNLGIPDCLVALRRRGAFTLVELKVVARGQRVRLSPHQIAFHHRHAELGCSTFIVILYVPAGGSASKDGKLLVYHGAQVLELAQSGIRTDPIAAWDYGNVPWSMVQSVFEQA